MKPRRYTATIRCPYRANPDDDPCEAPIHLVIYPAEPETWEYSGAPPSVASVEGCPHAQVLGEAILLGQAEYEADFRDPRNRADD